MKIHVKLITVLKSNVYVHLKSLPPPTTKKVNNLSLSAFEQLEDEALSKHSMIRFLKARACSNCFKKNTLCLFVPENKNAV